MVSRVSPRGWAKIVHQPELLASSVLRSDVTRMLNVGTIHRKQITRMTIRTSQLARPRESPVAPFLLLIGRPPDASIGGVACGLTPVVVALIGLPPPGGSAAPGST